MGIIARKIWALGVMAGFGLGCGGGAPGLEFPETQRVAREPQKNESGVEVLLTESRYVLDGAGGYVNTWHQRYRIVDQGGIEGWSSIEAAYSPWFMERPTVEATVTAPSGEVTKLDPKVLSEAARYPDAPDTYGDGRVLRGPLPRIEVGAVVDEVIVTRTKRPFFGDGYVHYEPIRGPVPREHVELSIEAPAATPLHFEVRDADVRPEESTEQGIHRVRFVGGPYEAIDRPPSMMPSDAPTWPYVAFTTGSSWQSLASSYARVVEEKLSVAALADAANKAVSSGDSPRVKADKLLDWVRKRVRYVGVELGESAILPREPVATLKNAYGDCKDQATLLVSLLRAVDVPAHVALLRAGTGEDVRPGLPALNGFNHAIVVVPGEPPLWIDPTAPHARAGELPVGDGDRLALIADEGTTELVRTPSARAEDHRYEEVRSVYFGELGPARIVEVSTGKGHIEQDLRGGLAGPESALREHLERYVSSQYRAPKLGAFERSAPEDLARPLTLRIEADQASVGVTTLLEGRVFLDPTALFRWTPPPLFLDASKRGVDLAFSTPYKAEIRYEMHPPAGFVLGAPIPDRDASLGPATYTRRVKTRPDGVVLVTYSFTLPKGRMTVPEMEAFRVGYEKLGFDVEEGLSFVHEAERQRQARNARGAVAVLSKDLKTQPKSAIAHMRLGWMAAQLGFGHTARAEADKAISLDGSESLLWYYLGDIRRRDLLGRLDVEGWDLPGAIAAYRKGLALKPDSLTGTLALSELLEHDPRAVRYSPGAPLSEAITLLDGLDPAALRAHEGGSYVNNVLFDLFWAGRYDELGERLSRLEQKDRPAVLAVSQVAVRKGVAAAFAELDGFGLPAAERASILSQVGDTLTRLRRYPEASKITEAALASSTDPGLAKRARVRVNLRPVDYDKLPTRTPSDVARSAYTAAAVDASGKKPLLRGLVASRLWPDGISLSEPRVFAEAGFRAGFFPEVFGDVSDVQLHDGPTVDGDDAGGYRVLLHADGTADSLPVYVSREPEGYRIVSFGALEELGCEAYRLAKAGKTAPARRWLDWALEKRSGASSRYAMAFSLWPSTHDVTLTSGTLCAVGPSARAMAPELERLRASAPPALQDLYAFGPMVAAMGAHDAERLLTLAEGLEKSPTLAEAGRTLARLALGSLGRWEALRKKAEETLRANPDDEEARESLAQVLALSGKPEDAVRVMDALFATREPNAIAHGRRAWLACLADRVRPVDLASAQRAAELRPNELEPLFTLALTHASLGRIDDGRETLGRVLALRSLQRPLPEDWLVAGRLAEAAGLRDEARAAYARVEKDLEPLAWVNRGLVSRRLAAMR